MMNFMRSLICRYKSAACVIVACAIPMVCSADFMMLWNDDWLQQVKSDMESGQAMASPALDSVIRQADLALSRGPYSVTNKTGFPENRDIHDYYSQGPYWWPNPDTADGLPYIRRDGEVNPEKYGDAFDSRRRHDMIEDLTALSLAGFFTGDSRYLDHAAQQIRTWFIDHRTAMNPNMKFAQSIPGRSAGRATGIIDSRSFIRAAESALLLRKLNFLDDKDMVALREWFGRFADWLKTSENGLKEGEAKNNHGTFYDLQLAVFSWFSGDQDTSREVVSRFCERRVRRQVEVDGRMPHEIGRTKPFHYSVFNLQAMLNMALLARRIDEEMLPGHCTDDDRIQRAVEYVAGLGVTGKDWPQQPADPAYEPVFELLLLMHQLTNDASYQDKAMDTGRAFEHSVIHLLLPTQTTR